MDFINKNLKLKYFEKPYPYIIIENFFDEDFFKKIEEGFPSISDFQNQKNKINRMHYDTSFKDDLYTKLINLKIEYKYLHNYIYSNNFINYFLDLFKKDIQNEIDENNLKNIFDYKIQCDPYETTKITSKNDIKEQGHNSILYPRLDLGMGLIDYGKDTGGKGIHVDNPQRLISILLYLGGYKHIEGGELRIWEKKSENMELSNSIKPQPNSLVASLQSNLSFHDVNPVTKIEGSRNACYIAISSNNKIWKSIEDNKFNQRFHKNRVEKKSIITKFKNIFR